MRRSRLFIGSLVAILCMAIAAPVATAFIGRLANATVSFGQWDTDPPLDRFPNLSPIDRNMHAVIPHDVTIPAGGAINFAISGLHQVIVYDDGTRPEDIDAENTTPTTGTPSGLPLINDPTNRAFRGVDPSLLPRDRVEIVSFPKPGRFLVICGVHGHFVEDGMFGYVTVVPSARKAE